MEHDHTCSVACTESAEHMDAMDRDADRQLAEADGEE